ARALGYEVVLGCVAVGERAGAARDNLEQAARRARYEFLARVAREASARVVLAAHTLDDQAETVLLRLLRGSGAEGLGGIRPERVLEGADEVLLLRPLLGWARRADTEGYCRERGVESRVDEMNADERFARVRVRLRLMPLLETFNPRVAETLARTADLLSEDAHALELEAARLLDAARDDQVAEREMQCGAWPLHADVLAAAPRALRRRALRQWLARGRGDLRRLEAVHIAAVEKLLKGERGGRVVELPGGASVERRRGRLYFAGKKKD
ncbi:MAG: tRNA lysidine(34) synthetase TilS, partial [Acidobacteria bacterium]|nr:tRNA lysidine(34) synthetase TilS [Acidobacteriota bacterium]